MDQERLQRQMSFVLELDKEKEIFRQNYLADGSRKENDAEHAWHMALMAILLKEYANEPVDVLKTVTMILLHDVVEIDAGDTYAYGETTKAEQHAREAEAADRLFGMLPEDQGRELRSLWDEFEEMKTPEARFARTLDNIQPAMLNKASGGKSWIEHEVKLSKVLKRNSYTGNGSKTLWDYSRENIIMEAVAQGKIIDDTGNDGDTAYDVQHP